MRVVVRPSRQMRKTGGGGLGLNGQNRVGVLTPFGAKNKNGATGARLWRTKRGGAFFRVEGTLLERGTLGLRWGGGEIGRVRRGGGGLGAVRGGAALRQ